MDFKEVVLEKVNDLMVIFQNVLDSPSSWDWMVASVTLLFKKRRIMNTGNYKTKDHVRINRLFVGWNQWNPADISQFFTIYVNHHVENRMKCTQIS